MKHRRPRTERPARRRFQQMPRDVAIIYEISRMAQATSDQLCRLFFGDSSTCSRRLAKLVALGLLKVNMCHQDEPNIYTASVSGIGLVVDRGRPREELYRSRVGRNIDMHLRLLNDIRIEFILAVRQRSDIRLDAFYSDLDLRRLGGAPPPSYIPDAIIELTARGSSVYLLEIDTGTEGLAAFAPKIETTVTLWREQKRCWGAAPGTWRPIAFVPSARRALAIARTIVDAGGGALWLISEFARIRKVGAFGPAFALADDVATMSASASIVYRGILVHISGNLP